MEVLLRDLAQSISDAGSLAELARALLKLMEAITGLEASFMTRFDGAHRQLEVMYAHHQPGAAVQVGEGLTVPWDDALCNRAMAQDLSYTQHADTAWADTPVTAALGVKTYLSQPIRDASGSLLGTLCAASGSRVALGTDARQVVGLFARIIAHQVERERVLENLKKANEELVSRVMADPLTGIANRRALDLELKRALARAEREGAAVAVAVVDLDGFRAINDRLGHDIGDRFLIHVAGRLGQAVRPGDFVARYGGDEFVVLGRAGPGAGPGAVDAFRERVFAATRGRFASSETVFDYAGASVGAVLSRPGEDGPALLGRADAALSVEKQARRAAGLAGPARA